MPRAKKTPDVPADRLDGMLARLKLSGIRDQLDSLLDEAARSNLSTRETLTMLCEREIARKDHRRIEPEARLRHEMALKLAHFPAVKELSGFDFEAQPSIDPKQIRDLAASRWIANGENVLLLGPRLCGAQLRCDASARRTSPSRSAARRSSPATRCSSPPPWHSSPGSPKRTPRSGSTRSCSASRRRSC